jgi:hypothetical protein
MRARGTADLPRHADPVDEIRADKERERARWRLDREGGGLEERAEGHDLHRV